MFICFCCFRIVLVQSFLARPDGTHDNRHLKKDDSILDVKMKEQEE